MVRWKKDTLLTKLFTNKHNLRKGVYGKPKKLKPRKIRRIRKPVPMPLPKREFEWSKPETYENQMYARQGIYAKKRR